MATKLEGPLKKDFFAASLARWFLLGREQPKIGLIVVSPSLSLCRPWHLYEMVTQNILRTHERNKILFE